MARPEVEVRQEATGDLEKGAPNTARTDVSANETDSATASSLAQSGLMIVPQGNKWVVQDDTGRSWPVCMENLPPPPTEKVSVFERCSTEDGKAVGDWSYAATCVIYSEAKHNAKKEAH